MVTSRRLVAVLLTACFGLSGCSGSGSALKDDGALSEYGFPDVHVGDIVWFALPTFDNGTDQPVQLLTVRLADPPSSVAVLGYRGQSARARGAVQLDFRASGAPRENPMLLPDVPITSMVVPPHDRSDGYVMVELQLLKPVRVDLRKTDVTYRWQGQEYEQTLSMDLVIEGS